MRGPNDYDRPFPRLGEMMTRLALDPVVALQCEPAPLGAAIQRWQACPCDAVCGNWLARAAERIEAAPAFCPNAALFAALRGRKPAADVGCWL